MQIAFKPSLFWAHCITRQRGLFHAIIFRTLPHAPCWQISVLWSAMIFRLCLLCSLANAGLLDAAVLMPEGAPFCHLHLSIQTSEALNWQPKRGSDAHCFQNDMQAERKRESWEMREHLGEYADFIHQFLRGSSITPRPDWKGVSIYTLWRMKCILPDLDFPMWLWKCQPW